MTATLVDASPDPAADKMRRFKRIFPLLLATMGVGALDQQIVNTALPRIAADLGQLQQLSWILTAFMLAQTVTMPLYGKLSDIYGRKRLLMISLSIFLIGSALCSIAQSMLQLILFRAVQGLGGGGLFTLTSAVIGDFLSPRERGRYAGYTTSVFVVCTIAGPLAGGVLTSALGWRSVFWVNLPFAGVVLVLLTMVLPSTGVRHAHKVDVLGAALVAAGAIPMLLGLSWAGVRYGWTSPVIVGLLAFAALAFVTLIVQERRAAEPILAIDLFAIPTVRWAALSGGVIGFAFFGSTALLPLFFQVVEGYSPSAAGMMIVPQIAGTLVASVVGGRHISRTGRYRNAIVGGSAGLSGAFLALGLLVGRSLPVWTVEISLFCLGVSGNTCILGMNLGVQNAVDQRRLGAALSSTSFLNALAGAAGVALAGAIMAQRLLDFLIGKGISIGRARQAISHAAPGAGAIVDPILRQAYRAAISSSFIASAVIAAIAIGTVLLIPDHPLRSRDMAAEAVPVD